MQFSRSNLQLEWLNAMNNDLEEACRLLHSCLEWDNGGERDYTNIVAFLNRVESRLIYTSVDKDKMITVSVPKSRPSDESYELVVNLNKDGFPIAEHTICNHSGCRGHVSHPCEGCGRQWSTLGGRR
jgi:hypothetical protein